MGLKGFCMGAADIVPGVSGGTMAFILGIYEELLLAIRSFDLTLVRRVAGSRFREALDGVAWRFLVPLLTGILTAIFSLAKGLAWLLVNQPVYIWSFFFGLVLASVITVTGRVERITAGLGLWALLGAAGAYVLVGLVPMTTPNEWWFLVLSGSVAICAMILPGISGSFVLVLLGKYQYVLQAVNSRDFLTLALVASGAVLGLILFSRFLSWLLKTRYDPTIAVLCGLMIGSLRKVWPWKTAGLNALPNQVDGGVLLAILLAATGVAIVLYLDRLAGGPPGDQS
ncbi:MAG: DUF368 domain-containing protein [Proteobacteria bacterium]|nr:DUF368 domain-containing protein [Pseudomonadota bacterium]